VGKYYFWDPIGVFEQHQGWLKNYLWIVKRLVLLMNLFIWLKGVQFSVALINMVCQN
jgi:hypothetical protein